MTIGNRESSVMFSYLDENGKPIGYSVELACPKLAPRPLDAPMRFGRSRRSRVNIPSGGVSLKRRCWACARDWG
jgi:hypothetical protein